MYLGINLASEPFSYGICNLDRVIVSVSNSARSFTENIIHNIEKVCQDFSISWSSFTAIGVTAGPGSYTGLRVGVSVAKTIGQVCSVPVYPVSTLEALVYPFSGVDGLYFSVIPARKEEVNVALFSVYQGQLSRMCPDYSCSLSMLQEKLSRFEKSVTVVSSNIEYQWKSLSHLINYVSVSIKGETIAEMARLSYEQKLDGNYNVIFPKYSHSPFTGPPKSSK